MVGVDGRSNAADDDVEPRSAIFLGGHCCEIQSIVWCIVYVKYGMMRELFILHGRPGGPRGGGPPGPPGETAAFCANEHHDGGRRGAIL